jgi:hypothetical protein
MTAPQPKDHDERISELEHRIMVLEEVIRQRDQIIAQSVLDLLVEHTLIQGIVQRVAAAVEAEWTGKFLPELRATLREDLGLETSQPSGDGN